MLLLFALFVVGLCKKSYEGHQVLRIHMNADYDVKYVLDLAEKVSADVWAANPMWADVMVNAQQFPYFARNLTYEVSIPDVQASLDQHEKENTEAREKAKVGFEFDWFPTMTEIRAWLNTQNQRPDTALVNIGSTYGGAQITGIAFGNPTKDLYYMHCTIHAREWISTTSCLWIIDQLLNVDPERAALLTEFYWIIVPVQNIDGYTYSHNSDRLWRKNREPNTGSTCVGTDVNRNYGFQWGGEGAGTTPCSETYRGRGAWSSPEASAENTFLVPYLQAGRVAAYVDIHAYGAYVLSAWGYTTTTQPKDYAEMQKNMVSAVAAIRSVDGRTYTYGPSGRTLYVTSGSTVDQYYGAFNVINSYTIEVYGTNFTPSASWIPVRGAEVWAGIKQLAKDILAGGRK